MPPIATLRTCALAALTLLAASIAQAQKTLGGTCKSCHDRFRETD